MNKSIFSTLIGATLIAGSMAIPVAQADNSCNVNLNADVRISPEKIEFFDNDQALYYIEDDHKLFVNGKRVSLSRGQQSLVNEFSEKIRGTVPEVKAVAIDGVDLAIEGVNLAFNELLGQGNSVSTELTEKLTSIKRRVSEKLDQNATYTIDKDGKTVDSLLGEDFEQEVEEVVEGTIKQSMGSLLIAVGQELLTAGGDMSSFEQKMEDFGQRIELEMEQRAERIETRAEALCQSVVVIDQLENEMSESIDELSDINVISASQHSQKT